ncbi:MAG: hypothetical protein K940chlam2_01318, partial [Chlamydiae bacterium]|nr:hypothetical protein [Chlamydiota bacterium]
VQMFKQMEISILGIVANMGYFIYPASGVRPTTVGCGGGSRLAKEWELPLLAEIPLDPALSKAGDEGHSIFDVENALSREIFEELGFKIQAEVEALSKGTFSVWLAEGGVVAFEFGDGKEKRVAAATLQSHCPCARCRGSGKSLADVQPFGVEKVGRYGLRVQFTSGCSQGLYPHKLLEELSQ